MEMETSGINYNGYTNQNSMNNVQSLTFKDVSAMRYVWLGVEVSLARYMHKNKHATWTIIFGLLSIGTAGSIIEDIMKPV